MNIEARPWSPQDLLDDLQNIIDEESGSYLNTRRTTLETALAYLKEYFAEDTNVPGWIPVTERLPEEREAVLVLCKNGMIFVGFQVKHNYESGIRWQIYTALGSTKSLNKGRVSHWMPLPEPPKGG